MIVETDINLLRYHQISANQYIFCYLLYMKKYDILNAYLTAHNFSNFEIEIEQLMTMGLLSRFDYATRLDIKGYTLTDKCLEMLSTSSMDLFDEFLSEFPSKVIRSEGNADFLKSNVAKCRLKYKAITKGKRHIHEHVLDCLRYELELKQASNSMRFMKKLPNWLESEEWKAYEDELKNGNKIEQNLGYGTKLE
jgi:hypothetical protein